jgi:Na+-transporting NADH:ubiquinone oxidoreductase subunit A
MSKDIKIKKGLNINLVGEAEKSTENAIISNFYCVRPEDFHSIKPKLVAKEGTKVKAGETLFYNKEIEDMKFVSPVSGEVVEIQRGPKRRIDAIKVQADKTQSFQEHGTFDMNSSAEEIKAHLLASGCWPFIKQRPYDVIANPGNAPKGIFISGYASAPLAADLDYTLKGKEKELQAAVTALSKLTEGQVHISVGKNSDSPLAGLDNVQVHKVSGPHPSGNVGTLINKIDPCQQRGNRLDIGSPGSGYHRRTVADRKI